MKICLGCGNEIPATIVIDGKRRWLDNRKYCFVCSPFGKHNTKKLNGDKRKDQGEHKCKCGETDQEKFYGNKRSVCAKCHNKYVIDAGREKRKRAISLLGGSCVICGYDKYHGSLDFHHLDKDKKDDNFANLKGWSWSRIEKEIQRCVLLCRNCHGEVHAGISKIP